MGTDTRRWSHTALGLYVVTLALELPVTLLRIVFFWFIAAIVLLLTGHSIHHVTAADNWALLAFGPLVWSAAAFIPHTKNGAWTISGIWLLAIILTAVGNSFILILAATAWAAGAWAQPWTTGWWWQLSTGGREPSTRELAAYQEAIEELQERADGPLPLPSYWFVIDNVEMGASVCGNTLMVSRDLLASPYLPAVLAHELGHLDSTDATIATALNRLVLQPFRSGRVRLWRGGLALRILQPMWAVNWRAREYGADQYAAKLGQGSELAQFLQTHALAHDRPVPFIWLSDETHPPTELRIDKLTQQPDAVAA